MKKISRLSILAIMLVAVTVYTNAAALQAPQAPQAPQAAQEEKQFQGSLVSIDEATHMLTAKAADEKEWRFSYSDKTELVGADKPVKSGAKLTITYTVLKGTNLATRIEMLSVE